MKPKSDNLFHFTKTVEVLKLILENGIYPRYCLEDFSWFNDKEHKYIGYPMSCFCDIPLSRIAEHTDFYGSYGIGFTKEWGLRNYLNPVIYTSEEGRIQSLAKYLFYLEYNETKEDEYNKHLYSLLSLIKPITGTMVVSGEVVQKDFYQESEWRYVPPVNNLLTSDIFEQEKEKNNALIEEFKLELTPKDIKYIFVRTDQDIPKLVDFINDKLAHFSLNDLKILQSRIISLDTLKSDM